MGSGRESEKTLFDSSNRNVYSSIDRRPNNRAQIVVSMIADELNSSRSRRNHCWVSSKYLAEMLLDWFDGFHSTELKTKIPQLVCQAAGRNFRVN